MMFYNSVIIPFLPVSERLREALTGRTSCSVIGIVVGLGGWAATFPDLLVESGLIVLNLSPSLDRGGWAAI
jgi:hypothetical protein